MEKGNLYILY